MADGDATIRLDQGGINARLLANEAKVDFRRVESASRKIQATFHSPEVKRLFVRYLNSMQLNMYLISVIGRTKLPHSLIEQVEGALKAKLENLHAEVNEAIDAAEALCKVHGITRLATYDTEPLAIEAKVISPFGRRYLELMTKVDQLMPMLETLAIDEVIEDQVALPLERQCHRSMLVFEPGLVAELDARAPAAVPWRPLRGGNP